MLNRGRGRSLVGSWDESKLRREGEQTYETTKAVSASQQRWGTEMKSNSLTRDFVFVQVLSFLRNGRQILRA